MYTDTVKELHAGLSCTELSIWEFPSLRRALGSEGVVYGIV
jgi:hypothetical protein